MYSVPFLWQTRISGSVLALFVCVLAFVPNGDAISCFVCDSSDNPSCADLKSNTSIVAEECSVTKMKSIKTWLFELNEISYFDTGIVKNPLMNCQKVVARNPNTKKMVTARFCQLDTGDSDACNILQNKLRAKTDFIQREENANSNANYNSHYNNYKNEHKSSKENNEEEAEEATEQQFHCSICNTDRCNGSEYSTVFGGSVFIPAMVLLLDLIVRRECIDW